MDMFLVLFIQNVSDATFLFFFVFLPIKKWAENVVLQDITNKKS